MIRRPPRSTLFPTRRSSDLNVACELVRVNKMNACYVKPIVLRGYGDVGERWRSEEHTSELQSRVDLVCRLLLEKKKHRPTVAYARQNSYRTRISDRNHYKVD